MTGALSTDLYEITMAAGYHASGRLERATFELWVRELPPERGYLVVAGLDQALEYLETLRFLAEDVAYLRTVPALQRVKAPFFDEYLPRFRFRGDVWAIPEGTPVFAGEPLLRVSASLPEAQVVETALLSTVLFQTMIASKASRVVHAARWTRGDRVRWTPSAWDRCRGTGSARLVCSWVQRDVQPGGWGSIRYPGVRNDGPLLGDESLE